MDKLKNKNVLVIGLGVSGRSAWLEYGWALAHGTVDPEGRPLQEWYAPTLREVMQRLAQVRYLLVFRSRCRVDPWVELARARGYFLLRLAVKDPASEGDDTGQARVFVDGAIEGEAFLVDLPRRRILGSIAFSATQDMRAEPYAAGEEPVLLADLERAVRQQVRMSLASVLPSASLPFTASGDLLR